LLLVQDAVVRAWDRFADLREPEHIRAWLYRIVRSLLADHHREKTRRRGLVSITRLEAAHELLVGSDDPSPLERVITLAAAERVHRALSLIPEEFAAAVELHDLSGLRYREVVEALDIPLGTVMSRISRGRHLELSNPWRHSAFTGLMSLMQQLRAQGSIHPCPGDRACQREDDDPGPLADQGEKRTGQAPVSAQPKPNNRPPPQYRVPTPSAG
jgi:RNA polymerase sigma factor (sigma-70 family)